MISKERFLNWEYPEIKDGVPNKFSWIVKNLKGFVLGQRTDIGAFTYINALHGVVIEEDVQIGSHCSIYSISTIDSSYGKVVIKANSKIGSHTTILPGVTIGENSVIGACSLINKNIPSNVHAFGVPVKIIRQLENE